VHHPAELSRPDFKAAVPVAGLFGPSKVVGKSRHGDAACGGSHLIELGVSGIDLCDPRVSRAEVLELVLDERSEPGKEPTIPRPKLVEQFQSQLPRL
jgi:hypothetical protein